MQARLIYGCVVGDEKNVGRGFLHVTVLRKLRNWKFNYQNLHVINFLIVWVFYGLSYVHMFNNISSFYAIIIRNFLNYLYSFRFNFLANIDPE